MTRYAHERLTLDQQVEMFQQFNNRHSRELFTLEQAKELWLTFRRADREAVYQCHLDELT